MGKVFGLIAILLVIGGGVYMYTIHISTKKNVALDALDALKDAKSGLEHKSLVSSLKEAGELGTTLRCTYATSDDETLPKSTVDISGEKFRTVTTGGGASSQVLFDGTDQYVWNDGSKQGFKMSKTCLEELRELVPEESDIPTSSPLEDTKAIFETAKDLQCVPTDHIDLSVPEEVTFADQCAALKDTVKTMEQYKNNPPTEVEPR